MTPHLTDKALQAYLDGDGGPGRQTLMDHIRLCPECRQRLEAYRELYAALATPPEPFLPQAFARITAARIVAQRPSPAPAPLWANETVLLAGLGLVSLGVSAVFIDWNALWGLLQRMAGGLAGETLVGGLLQRFGSSLPLLPVAGLAAGLVAWLDRRLQRRRGEEAPPAQPRHARP